MRAEEVLSFLLHHLQTVLEVLPAPFHQGVFAQKLPSGFVDEQRKAVLAGGRIDEDAGDVEAAVAILEGNILRAKILFDVCDCNGTQRKLQGGLGVLFITPESMV